MVLVTDAADHIGTKTATESLEHYNDLYINSSIGNATIPPFINKIVDYTSVSQDILSPTLLHPPEPVEMSAAEQQELGYMPLRDDFEKEYENDAETLLSGLQFSREDDELETEMKLAQTDINIRKLKERQRRKDIARQHGLIASKHKIIALRRRYSKEDREFRDGTRVFARFKSPSEWEPFLNSHTRERELKVIIKELMRYRRNGVTTLSDCQGFDEQRLRRERKKENKRTMVGGSTPRRTNVALSKAREVANDDKIIYSKDLPSSFADEMKSCSGYKLLSPREIQICSSMHMKPGFYLTIKTIILKDN